MNQKSIAIGISALAGLGYFLFSYLSDGFYQHDEITHYIGSKTFWTNPGNNISSFSKPGYRAFLSIISPLGYKPAHFFNAIVAGFSIYTTYLVALEMKFKKPLIPLIILALTPITVMMSFRSYPGIFTSLVLAIGALNYYRKNFIWAAFFIAYAGFIRTELYALSAIFGLYLLFNKQYRAIIVMAAVPILYNLAGWYFSDDPIYLLSQVFGLSESYSQRYPRQGAEHYPLMSSAIFGSVAIMGLFLYAVAFFRDKKYRLNSLPILIIAGTFIGVHIIFASKFLNIGPSSGGNLRYFTTVSPFVALLAGLGYQKLIMIKNKKPYIWAMVAFLIFCGLCQTYDDNLIKHIPNQRNWLIIIPPLMASLIAIKSVKKHALLLIFLSLSVQSYVSVKGINLSPEDEVMKTVATYLKESPTLSKKIIHESHSAFKFFYSSHFDQLKLLTAKSVDEIKQGELLLWESHYATKPERANLQFESLNSQTDTYRNIQVFQSSDKRFAAALFERL